MKIATVKTITIGGTEYTCPYLDVMPPLTPDELAELKADVAANGIACPVLVTDANEIIDGHNRMMLAAELGLTTVPMRVLTGLTADQKRDRAEDLNLHRRQGRTALKPHPYADLFPMMPDADLRAMADDIRANGLREKIATYQGMILDGRHRYRACNLSHVEPEYLEFDGDDAEALAFVCSKNLSRRHLTQSQRAIVAASLATMTVGQPKKNRANLPDKSKTNAAVAEMLGISERIVKTAKKVLEAGAPSLVKAVEDGEVSVSAAAEVAELPKAEQEKLVNKGPAAVKAKAAELRQAKKKPQPVSEPIPAPAATEPTDTLEAAEELPVTPGIGSGVTSKPCPWWPQLRDVSDRIVLIADSLKRLSKKKVSERSPGPLQDLARQLQGVVSQLEQLTSDGGPK